jgi:hypothetical protein
MRCIACHRPLKLAAITNGGAALGPVCARKMGLAISTVRQSRTVAQLGQLPLFGAEMREGSA